jgi:glycosyltransferase involved in cell wall biosynthesis
MKIFILAKKYSFFGGEERYVDSLKTLLESCGHSVRIFYKTQSLGDYVASRFVKDLAKAIAEERPHVVHAQFISSDLYPLIPLLKTKKIAFVVTLHNYRFFCLNGLCLRRDAACQDCMHEGPLQGLLNNCSGNPLKSLAYFFEVFGARQRAVLSCVDTFICPSEFVKTIATDFGIPQEKVRVVPFFVPVFQERTISDEGFGVFAGRIVREKGVMVLLEALRIAGDTIPLKIFGEGPCAEILVKRMKEYRFTRVEYKGFLSREGLLDEIARSRFAVVPSLCYETFSFSVFEAFLLKKPVVASNIGALSEFVKEGVRGITCKANDAQALARALRYIYENKDRAAQLGANAHGFARTLCDPRAHYERLTEIYRFHGGA